MTSWAECYRRYFTRYFGKPYDWETFRQDEGSPPLQIAVHDLVAKNRRLFTSLGLTAYAAEVQELAEVVLMTDAAWKEVPFLLANALFFMARRRIRLQPRLVIGGVGMLSPEFADQYDKEGLYFRPALSLPEVARTVECDGQIGLVYEALFVSSAEQSYIQRLGGQAFEEKLTEQAADPNSLLRPSCV
jgi:hypothetical protein